MAKMSRAMCASTGKSVACFYQQVLGYLPGSKGFEVQTFHHLRTFPSKHGYVPLKKKSISVMLACCWTGFMFQMASMKIEAPAKDVSGAVALGSGDSDL
jgi:hypothetical protein